MDENKIEAEQAGVTPENTGKTIPLSIEDEVKVDYLNYAMSTIVARALPDVRDGLKPVHRRILYAMDVEGLHNNAATRKSATVVGTVIGHYHPHGDAATYEAMVRMGQDFSLRYPLVKGQGNFGSIDGDPPAAYRYTEAKLSKAGDEMLVDLKKDTVDMAPNFDEKELEPTVLPAAIPNLLVNGSEGIAVGMATNMPPHNLREICDAVCAYIDDNDITIDDLMTFVKGPDFPTGGVIFGRRGITEAYKTGRGKVLLRGKFEIETAKNGKETIVFTEIPYGVKPKVLLERISSLVRDKEIDGVSYCNDESDRDGIRVIIELKKDAIMKVVLNQLFAQTTLQSTFGIINLALVNGKPQQLTLKELIVHFVNHRVDVVTRRTRFDLRKAEERENILEGLVITLANIDEVVAIIKAADDVEGAKKALKDRFLYPAAREKMAKTGDTLSPSGLTGGSASKVTDMEVKVEAQAQAIVDMRLGRLTHLEVEKIEKELAEIRVQIAYYKDLLASPAKLLNVIKEETRDIAARYGDERKTEIVSGEVENINIEDLIKKEEMMITISKLGYVKRVPVSAYRNQGRGGKGMQSAKLNEDDFVNQIFVASTHEFILFITNEGRAYWLKVHELPEGTRTSKGTHIKSILSVSPNEEIAAIVSLTEEDFSRNLLLATAQGVVKKTLVSEFQNAKTRGVAAIKLHEGDKLVTAILTRGVENDTHGDEIVLISRKGKALRTGEDTIRVMGRASSGVRGMKLGDDDELAGALRVDKSETMLILTEYGYGKRVDFEEFSQHGRATGGQRVYGVTEKTGEISGCVTVREDEEVMVITSQGKSIKLKVSSIRVMGTSAQGVRILSIDKPDFVIGVDRIVNEDAE